MAFCFSGGESRSSQWLHEGPVTWPLPPFLPCHLCLPLPVSPLPPPLSLPHLPPPLLLLFHLSSPAPLPGVPGVTVFSPDCFIREPFSEVCQMQYRPTRVPPTRILTLIHVHRLPLLRAGLLFCHHCILKTQNKPGTPWELKK